MDDDFVLDNLATEAPNEVNEAPIGSPVNSYVNVFDEAKAESGGQRRSNRPGCFNCGQSGHSVNDCKAKRDPQRIKRARAQHNANRAAMGGGGARYTGATGAPGPGGRFRVGQISFALERALGVNLKNGQIPEHILRMRQMGLLEGYPPGYLKSAIVGDDHIVFHTNNHNDTLRTEDGEIIRGVNVPVVDESKMIQYDFFNCPSRIFDDRRHHTYPRWSEFITMHNNQLESEHRRKMAEMERRDSSPMRLDSSVESITVTVSGDSDGNQASRSDGVTKSDRLVTRRVVDVQEEGEVLEECQEGSEDVQEVNGTAPKPNTNTETDSSSPPESQSQSNSQSTSQSQSTLTSDSSSTPLPGLIKHTALATCTPMHTPLSAPTLGQMATGVVPFEPTQETPVKGPGFRKIRQLLSKVGMGLGAGFLLDGFLSVQMRSHRDFWLIFGYFCLGLADVF